ncbi:MAG: hypothetical protein ACM3JD_03660 [Rudaea sp.]
MDEQKNQPGATQPGGEAWREVGREFQTLGKTLADAMRAALTNEENRRRIQEMQSGLESMVKEVNSAIKESYTSPQAQQARSQAGRTAETLRAAGEQTVQDIRPQVVAALRQLNQELERLTNRMRSEKADAGKTQDPTGTPKP